MQWLKQTDFYRKIPRDLTEGTLGGGGLSVVGAFVMFLLFILEFRAFLTPQVQTNVLLDANADEMIQINFNVTLPRLPCHLASLDVTDILGYRKVNMTRNIRKWKLTSDGSQKVAEMHDVIQAPKHEDEGTHPEDPIEKAPSLNKDNFKPFVERHGLVLVNYFAPWCYWSRRLAPTWHHTAALVSRKPYGYDTKLAMVDCTDASAVNLCYDAHINAFPTVVVYREGKLDSHEHYHGDRTAEAFLKFIEGVRAGLHHETAKALGHKVATTQENANTKIPVAKGPQGCLIAGFLEVKRVPGSLAIAAHSKHHSIQAAMINTTHKITHFSYGKVLPTKRSFGFLAGVYDSANRLAGTYWKTNGANHTHEHFLKVVSTVYRYSSGRETNAYKYTAHSHEYQDNDRFAAARFTYDLSPMSVIATQSYMPFYHFITSACAIIGGVFTVIGLLDAVLYHGIESIRGKRRIGKLG